MDGGHVEAPLSLPAVNTSWRITKISIGYRADSRVLWVLLTVQSGTFHTARYRNRSDRHLNFAQIGFILAAHLSSRKDKSLFSRLKQLLSVSFIVVCVLMTWLSFLAGNGGVIRVPYMLAAGSACVRSCRCNILEGISIAKPRHRPGPSARSRLNAALIRARCVKA